MTTYRVNHDRSNPYVRLNKAFLESPDLSAKAKGILAYLLFRSPCWKFSLAKLVGAFADGESSIRSGLKKLKEAGYVTKTSLRNSQGQITRCHTKVY